MEAFIEDAVDNPDQLNSNHQLKKTTTGSDDSLDSEEDSLMPIYIQCIGCIKSDVVYAREGLLQCYQCGTRSHVECIKAQFGIDGKYGQERWLCPQCDPAIELWDDQ